MTTFRSQGSEQLTALCRAVGFEARPAVEAFETLVEPWGELPVGTAPRWASDITDDGSPYEFSLGIEGARGEPRFLVESQGRDGSLSAAWTAAQETNERLRRRYGTSLERLSRIEDLFAPRYAGARFAMWHAAWLRAGAEPLFKVYLNPDARGPGEAPALVEEALGRLGFSGVWPQLAKHLSRRAGADRLIYFSLDLAADEQARVKVYIAHERGSAEDVEPLLATGPEYVPGDAHRFCQALTGTTGPFTARPLLTCLAYVANGGTQPSSVTLHLPIRCYARDDGEASRRVVEQLGVGKGAMYLRALQALAGRPLEAGTGLQTYVSYRRQRERLRTTIYLSPELYSAQRMLLAATARPPRYAPSAELFA